MKTDTSSSEDIKNKSITKVRLGDVCKIIYGERVRKIDSTDITYPVYGGGGETFRWATYNRENACVVSRFAISKECVRFVKGKFFLNDSGLTVTTLNKSLNQLFLEWFLYGSQAKIYACGQGVAQRNLEIKRFRDLLIPLPPCHIQQKIVSRLQTIHAVIEKRKSQLAQLNQLVKSQFVEMFGDAKYPERELITVTTFIDYRGKTPTKSDSGVPLITAKNIRANGFSIEPREYMPETLFAEWMTRGFPRVGDVLFTTEAPLGNVCRIPNLYGRFAVGQRIVTMQVMQEVLDPSYLEHALKSDSFQRKIKQKSSGSTVTGIRSKLLEKLTVPIPPLALQREFAAFVEKVDKLAFAARKRCDKAKQLYKAKIQEYFG